MDITIKDLSQVIENLEDGVILEINWGWVQDRENDE